jgi:hypothetical protein
VRDFRRRQARLRNSNKEIVMHTEPDTRVAARRPRRSTARTYTYQALQGTAAVNLDADELALVTQALNLLERKLLKQRDIFNSPATVKQWLVLH